MQEIRDLMLQLQGCLNTMQVDKSMHALIISMIYPNDELQYFYLCSCMESGMHTVQHGMVGDMSSAVTAKVCIFSDPPEHEFAEG